MVAIIRRYIAGNDNFTFLESLQAYIDFQNKWYNLSRELLTLNRLKIHGCHNIPHCNQWMHLIGTGGSLLVLHRQ